jgi:hypothetical protein
LKAAPLGVGELGAVTTASCEAAAAFTVAVNVTGLPLTPVSVAVTVALPAPLGSVHPVIAATPLPLVVTSAGLVGAIVPPATVNVTPTLGTGFCAASRTTTAGKLADGTALPAAPLSVVATLGAIDAAEPAVPVAVKVAVDAPGVAAVSVFAPAVVPSRQLTLAVPAASVVTCTLAANVPPLLTAPLPDAIVKVTDAFGTTLLFTSRTTTVGCVATVVFTVAD